MRVEELITTVYYQTTCKVLREIASKAGDFSKDKENIRMWPV